MRSSSTTGSQADDAAGDVAGVAASDHQPGITISVVIAVKDEAANVAPLASEIDRCFAALPYRWEVLWVNDGSGDGTLDRLRELPPPHRWLDLDRNHGQSVALIAGARAARGTWIATLDGDGQNDPADLPRQYAVAQERGFDMVNGIRSTRHDPLLRRLCSAIANWTRNRVTHAAISDVGCSTRVLRRAALLELPFFDGMHRFLPTLVQMQGYRIHEIPVNHRPRRSGRSKYGINNRLWAGLRDLFAVRWLLSRQRQWQITAHGGESAQHVAASSSPSRAPTFVATEGPLQPAARAAVTTRGVADWAVASTLLQNSHSQGATCSAAADALGV